MPPEVILQRMLDGDTAAFRELYDLFYQRVYNTCLLYLQQVPEAEEAVQDVFLELYQSAAKFRADASLTTWIYRIAVNKCLDRLRYKQRQKRFAFLTSIFHRDTGELLHDMPVPQHPGIVLEQKENTAVLYAAIRQLPDNQQTAFILKQAEGLPQKEIAQIMGVTEKAVEALLQRAKANLRQKLGDFFEKRRK